MKTFQDVKNKLYDSSTWNTLSGKDFQHGDDPEIYIFRNIRKHFSEDQFEQIKLAFENKTKISIHRNGNSVRERDYSVHTAFDNGEFQAWFSSEYHRCGNGNYYLLLNPTTAVFMEHD